MSFVSFLLTCPDTNIQVCLEPPSFQTQRIERTSCLACFPVCSLRCTSCCSKSLHSFLRIRFVLHFFFTRLNDDWNRVKSNNMHTQYMQHSHVQYGLPHDFGCCARADQKPLKCQIGAGKWEVVWGFVGLKKQSVKESTVLSGFFCSCCIQRF